MPPLRKRFLFNRTTQADLTKFGRARWELVSDTAGTFSLAAQHRPEHPRRAELRTATKHFLESLVAQLLKVELRGCENILACKKIGHDGLKTVMFSNRVVSGRLA